jgi:hypothetical protein
VPFEARIPAGSGGGQIAQPVSTAGFGFDEAVLQIDIGLVVRHVDRVPGPLVALRVEKDHVVDTPVKRAALLGIAVRRGALPDDLAAEVGRAEDLVADQLEVVAYVGRAVQVQRSVGRQQLVDQDEALVHHRQVGLAPSTPRVAVGMLLEHGRELVDRCITDPDPMGEVGTRVERRIDIDELDLAGVLRQKAAHHELVVAPDQLITGSRGVRRSAEQPA